jgi:hypothetical protein
MNTRRVSIHLISVFLLLMWGAILLYFYMSGRLVPWYLQPLGNFRNMVLFSAVGLIALGIFNLATMGAEDAECCGHDHSHDHDHAGCCGHDHDDGHHHSHDHDDCCGHDHAKEHAHHEHDHQHGEAHGHGILEDSGSLGRSFAILVLAVPMLIAATMTPDKPSAAWVQKKGLYSQTYGVGSRAEQFSLRTKPGAPAVQDRPPAAKPEIVASAMPADDSQRTPGSASTASTTATTTATAKAGQAKSFGTFTLADLKAQVPQNKDGDFMLEVPELYYTAGDKEVQGALNGQPIITTAQVLPEKVNNEAGNRMRIFRLMVQCCAADAKPYSVPIEFAEKAPDLPDMSWVEIRGTMDYRQENNQTVPLLKVTAWKEAPSPKDTMLY